MTIDTEKLEDLVNETNRYCSDCRSVECGDCVKKKILDVVGWSVPQHPSPCPF